MKLVHTSDLEIVHQTIGESHQIHTTFLRKFRKIRQVDHWCHWGVTVKTICLGQVLATANNTFLARVRKATNYEKLKESENSETWTGFENAG